MGKLLVKEKEIVVPGDVIAEGMDYLPSFGTYRAGEMIIANRIGLLLLEGKVVKTIPVEGRYIPKRNDTIIGKVFDILMSGWRLDINSAYSAVLPLQEASFKFIQRGADLSKFFALEDYVVAKIINVTSQNLVDVTMKGPGLRKLDGGRIIKINSHKVPRVIGKQGSMVSVIKDATGCRITVGQNGVVWIQGEPEQEVLTVKAIEMIEEKSHHTGLTDEIKNFLDKNKVKVKGEKQ
ncbi:MAG: exosome complex protein Rrp4 [Nanoarchaeota archaeon]|nr:exosome complex protein Rrp4 [Nanoarchaeota archaeon]MBU1854364.1 exosome complex protein Rrp4 [Nanoarchaeota archaeon]